jgi:XRE family transcriptional regulator, regulator of sulfur utilization
MEGPATRYLYRDRMSPRKIGAVLKRLRAQKKLSQLQLADRAGVPQGYISELEAGKKKNPGIETLRKLARALGKDLKDLL